MPLDALLLWFSERPDPPRARDGPGLVTKAPAGGASRPTDQRRTLPPGSVHRYTKRKESPGGEAGAFKETSLMNLGIKVP